MEKVLDKEQLERLQEGRWVIFKEGPMMPVKILTWPDNLQTVYETTYSSEVVNMCITLTRILTRNAHHASIHKHCYACICCGYTTSTAVSMVRHFRHVQLNDEAAWKEHIIYSFMEGES